MGDNQGGFPEIGMYDAFSRLIIGESPLLDGHYYNIKDKVDAVLSKFNINESESSYPIEDVVVKIENKGLTGYYLEQKFVDDEKSGLIFVKDGEEKEEIELHYENKTDLEKKLSYILMMLTDR